MSLPYKKMGEPNLGSLHGHMRYDGMEYDREVPNFMVTASPGGVSDIHHHWTHGMYSHEVNTSDIYGHTAHNQYPTGAYGNMYQPGHTSSVVYNAANPPYDPEYWNNQAPPKEPSVFEPVAPAEIAMPEFFTNLKDPVPSVNLNINGWVLFIVLIFAAIALDFWTQASRRFMTEVLGFKDNVSWKILVAYALVVTGVLAFVAWMLQVPLTSVE